MISLGSHYLIACRCVELPSTRWNEVHRGDFCDWVQHRSDHVCIQSLCHWMNAMRKNDCNIGGTAKVKRGRGSRSTCQTSFFEVVMVVAHASVRFICKPRKGKTPGMRTSSHVFLIQLRYCDKALVSRNYPCHPCIPKGVV